MNIKAPFFAVSRHRIETDGKGVTTLVGFHGCPLRCKYCLNPESTSEKTPVFCLTPEELYQKVKIDQLYFLASGGGVTFGGGEPLLYTDFLKKFRELCGRDWRLCAETSLAVPEENLRLAANIFDSFFIDCKDTNPDIYFRYTGKSNEGMLKNLSLLASLVPKERITVRLPLIPGFNSDRDREKSETLLRSLGIIHFDRFTYRISEQKKQSISL